MDLNDIMNAPTGVKRPEHPDFWKLSEIILGLKAETEDMTSGRLTLEETTAKWRANYEQIGDFDSIAYCAIQAALDIHGISTGMDWAVHMSDPKRHQSYVGTVQAYFDGFIMGAKLERSRKTELPLIDRRDMTWFLGNDQQVIPHEEVILLLASGKARLTDRAALYLAEMGDE